MARSTQYIKRALADRRVIVEGTEFEGKNRAQLRAMGFINNEREYDADPLLPHWVRAIKIRQYEEALLEAEIKAELEVKNADLPAVA